MTEASALSLPMETSSSPTVPLQVRVLCVTCGIITSILFQAADVVKTEPSASSLPTEALSSPTDPLQVEVFCVTWGIITSILFQIPPRDHDGELLDEPSGEDVEAQTLVDSAQVGRLVVLFLDQSYLSSIRRGRG